ncbi:hypothetical protein V8E51_014249 [Hyaloscypha variabilis]
MISPQTLSPVLWTLYILLLYTSLPISSSAMREFSAPLFRPPCKQQHLKIHIRIIASGTTHVIFQSSSSRGSSVDLHLLLCIRRKIHCTGLE